MNSEQFKKYWRDHYPESYPIGFELKIIYRDRWFRIHCLPDSKRYADDENEYEIILLRQNNLISDVFADNLDFVLLIGLYSNDLTNENYNDLDYLTTFQKVDTVDLHEISPNDYDDEMYYEIFMRNEKWSKDSYNHILRKIADDEIRAIFVNHDAHCIVAPYDGGVDIILKDSMTRDRFKAKYSDWLSKREDGL